MTSKAKTFYCYIDDGNDNDNNNKNAIEWIKIKDNNSHEILLTLPYSSKISINNFKDAVYKNIILLPKTTKYYIMENIKRLYIDNKIIFTKLFLEKITLLKNETFTLNINLTPPKELMYTFVYFLTFLYKYGPFQLNSIDKDALILESSYTEMEKNIDLWKSNKLAFFPNIY